MTSISLTRGRGEPVRRNTRHRILATAEMLLLTWGYQGFSYHHVAERLGMRPATVHYHFPTKADLGLALLQRYRERFRWWAWRLREQKASPEACLEHFITLERRLLERDRVCPLSVVCVEMRGVSDAIRAETQRLFEDARLWLETVLESGRRSGAFTFEGCARTRALGVLAVLQGALQLGRLVGEEAFDALREQLRRELGMASAAGA